MQNIDKISMFNLLLGDQKSGKINLVYTPIDR